MYLFPPLVKAGVGRGKDISTITGHRGKDISTILDEERKENKRPQRAAAARRKKRRRLNDLDSDSNLDEEESEDEFKISDGCVLRRAQSLDANFSRPGRPVMWLPSHGFCCSLCTYIEFLCIFSLFFEIMF